MLRLPTEVSNGLHYDCTFLSVPPFSPNLLYTFPKPIPPSSSTSSCTSSPALFPTLSPNSLPYHFPPLLHRPPATSTTLPPLPPHHSTQRILFFISHIEPRPDLPPTFHQRRNKGDDDSFSSSKSSIKVTQMPRKARVSRY